MTCWIVFGGTKNCGFFGLFSGDKGDYIDVRMIKIRIKTKLDHIQKPCLSYKSGFFQ